MKYESGDRGSAFPRIDWSAVVSGERYTGDTDATDCRRDLSIEVHSQKTAIRMLLVARFFINIRKRNRE
jgi:hypothetical protein